MNLIPRIKIQTLSGFRVWRAGNEIASTDWGRLKAQHLIQFFVTFRRHLFHKEQIIDRLWPELDMVTGDRDFKIALNAVLTALEPDRKPRSSSPYIVRNGLAYQLSPMNVEVDADVFEKTIIEANKYYQNKDKNNAITRYQDAVQKYTGEFIPERLYEDWTTSERERLHILALGAFVRLANLLVELDPLESIRLTQNALSLEPTWEDAYRVQMLASMAGGNRPLAVQTYQRCKDVLGDTYGLEPLPETQEVYFSKVLGTEKKDG